jgi:O-antigen/teichoic acid export membrane protein
VRCNGPFFHHPSADLFFVKRILIENVEAGYYTAASMLSRVPFYILSALGFALFPAISRSTAINDAKQTENYIAGSMRYLLMFLIPIILLVSATSESLVSLFYSSTYLPASPP